MKWMWRQIDGFAADLVGLLVLICSLFVVVYSVVVRQPLHFEVSFSPFSFSIRFKDLHDE